MKRYTFVLLLLALLSVPRSAAESSIAQFKFEEAEVLFDQKRYRQVVEKLDEAQQAFGAANAPILYLRIMARHELFKGASSFDYDALDQLRTECRQYINTFGSLPVLREQGREVYQILSSLDRHPPTRIAYAQRLLAEGDRAGAMRQFRRAEERGEEVPEPDHYQLIVTLFREVEAEYYEDADRARWLAAQVASYLNTNGAGNSSNQARVTEVRLVENTLRGLEDYLAGKRFHNLLKDYEKAHVHHTRAAEQGSPMGMAALGVLYYHGLHVEKDLTTAREWFEKAIAAGSTPLGEYFLGSMHLHGVGVSPNLETALELLSKSAERGFGPAMAEIGDNFFLGRGVTENRTTARGWYERAAAKKHPVAMRQLGQIYYHGIEVPRDLTLAYQWHAQAADLGDETAIFMRGWHYNFGQGVGVDHQKARQWLGRAAENGSVEAMHHFGLLLEAGLGGPRDLETARSWFEKATEKDFVESFVKLGEMHWNHNVARELFEKAAGRENADAMIHLGRFYQEGRGVERNVLTAQEWYQKAAEKEHPGGMYNLGLLYRDATAEKARPLAMVQRLASRVTESPRNAAEPAEPPPEEDAEPAIAPDHQIAREWFERAAEKGHRDSMLALVDLYERGGHGLRRNRQLATEWRQKAAAVN